MRELYLDVSRITPRLPVQAETGMRGKRLSLCFGDQTADSGLSLISLLYFAMNSRILRLVLCPVAYKVQRLLMLKQHMNHLPTFHKLRVQLQDEVWALRNKNYYGDGMYSAGQRIADSSIVAPSITVQEDFPDYIVSRSANTQSVGYEP